MTDDGAGRAADPADQYQCTEIVLEETPAAAIVSNLGTSSYVLIDVADRGKNFYMDGGMGVTTPIGLGLSTAIDEQVTVLDGDGSLLMSLGCLATVGRHGGENLTIVIWDNGAFETTGGQRTLADQVDFAGVARDCGIESWSVSTTDAFRDAYAAAVEHEAPAVVHVEVAADTPEDHPSLDYGHSYAKHRFRQAVGQTDDGR